MRKLLALVTAASAAAAVPASAHDFWAHPQVVVVRPAVWVNPGVYVSPYSAVTRDYPYVGCCQPAFENWSLRRPYPGWRATKVRLEHGFVPHRQHIPEPPQAADRLHYPDGRSIERFVDQPRQK